MTARMPSMASSAERATPVISTARHATPTLQRSCSCGGNGGGECESCRKKRLQRHAASASGSSAVPPVVHQVIGSAGQPLDPSVRGFFEARMGHDFSRVRLHADDMAGTSAQAVSANAYAVGEHIVFAPGRYRPGTADGDRLLAHELTHVVQQSGATGGHTASLRIDAAGEAEAERAADQVMRGGPARVGSHAMGFAVQRDAESKPKSCAGWTCLKDLSKCEQPDPGKEGNGTPSTSWTLSAMIDVDVFSSKDVGATTFGHSYVRFTESNGAQYTYGFYPQTQATVALGSVKETPGCIVHPDTTHTACVDYEESFPLDKTQYDAALANAKLWCSAPPPYHLFDVNCTTFVAKVVEKAGKSLPTYRGKVGPKGGVTADNPNTLLESLYKRDRKQARESFVEPEWLPRGRNVPPHCATPCAALDSMRRAATHICGLAGEKSAHCTQAREKVAENEKRVSGGGCAC
jgi:hypothetical protein